MLNILMQNLTQSLSTGNVARYINKNRTRKKETGPLSIEGGTEIKDNLGE